MRVSIDKVGGKLLLAVATCMGLWGSLIFVYQISCLLRNGFWDALPLYYIFLGDHHLRELLPALGRPQFRTLQDVSMFPDWSGLRLIEEWLLNLPVVLWLIAGAALAGSRGLSLLDTAEMEQWERRRAGDQ
jgi:hypothetical protein